MTPVKKIIVAGNSASALLVAATLVENLKHVEIVLIDAVAPELASPAESSAVNINAILGLLAINPQEFIVNTQATVKLANHFVRWCDSENDFFHGFGAYGARLDTFEFVHWVSELHHYEPSINVERFSLAASAARAGRYAPSMKNIPGNLAGFNHGLHFNTAIFARYLLVAIQKAGVRLIREQLARVVLAKDGTIDHLQTQSGDSYVADFYVDCTGSGALLLGNAMGVPYDDWLSSLMVDRCLIAIDNSVNPQRNFLATQLQATASGFIRRIPLRNQDIYEFYYSSSKTSANEAQQEFSQYLNNTSLPLSPVIQFRPGRRAELWRKNCVAIGDAAANLGGGVYSAVFLTMAAVTRLLDYFPAQECSQPLIDEYNRVTVNELNRLRDYQALHYLLLAEGHPLKLDIAEQQLPELANKLRLFEASARLSWLDDEVAERHQWESLLLGMGVWPKSRNPFFVEKKIPEWKASGIHMQRTIAELVGVMPMLSELPTHFIYSKK